MQLVERGATSAQGELWVERLIGDFKQRGKFRTRSEPEKAMVADYQLQRALQAARFKYPHLKLQTWQEFSGQEDSSAVPHSVVLAEGHLLGKPQQLAAGVWGKLGPKVKDVLMKNLAAAAEWQTWADSWHSVMVQVYRRALLPGGGYSTSTSYSRSRSRDGTWIMVPYMVSSDPVARPYAARANYCLRLSMPAAGGEHVLRLAVCDLLSLTRWHMH